jgi:hypothetical protein
VAHSLFLPSIRPSQEGKSVPHLSRSYRDEWAGKPCLPLRLDFNRPPNFGGAEDDKGN